MRRLLKLSKNELHKIAQLRDIDTTNVKKQDLIYMLLRSQSNVKESQYLSFLNQNTTFEIELKPLFNNIVNNRKIKKADLKKISDHLDQLLVDIKYKRKSHYTSHDYGYYYDLKDLAYIFGDTVDYYKPILARQLFYDKNTSTLKHQE